MNSDFHLDMRVSELIARGLPEAAAREQALNKEFGDPERGAAGCEVYGERVERRNRVMMALSDLLQDVRYAVRLLGRDRGFAAVAILTLTLAIGGNAAIFSLFNALLLKPLAVTAPHELVRIHPGSSRISGPNARDFRERMSGFSDLMLQRGATMNLQTGDLPVKLIGNMVSRNHFTMLGTVRSAAKCFCRPTCVRTWPSSATACGASVSRAIPRWLAGR